MSCSRLYPLFVLMCIGSGTLIAGGVRWRTGFGGRSVRSDGLFRSGARARDHLSWNHVVATGFAALQVRKDQVWTIRVHRTKGGILGKYLV